MSASVRILFHRYNFKCILTLFWVVHYKNAFANHQLYLHESNAQDCISVYWGVLYDKDIFWAAWENVFFSGKLPCFHITPCGSYVLYFQCQFISFETMFLISIFTKLLIQYTNNTLYSKFYKMAEILHFPIDILKVK